ncbi:urease accessory protein UreF [Planobispora siamensis]|uniref:Urease accessory protein UreF n=1 Tax=Planobispora siamensis TaxID=936338 RepID=A0A8J3SFJ0_9ACTN|nr:urease accessory UreF family protein [Planobispora siamensis]GIH92145.1 hypothetical protein Psi01_27750 [Planobispora siamensis]
MSAPSPNAALLLLADSRLPAGGHGHSGGAEAAIASGAVRDLPTLAAFLHGRLATTGLVTASLAAAACALGASIAASGTADARAGEGGGGRAEADMPVPADGSRSGGRAKPGMPGPASGDLSGGQADPPSRSGGDRRGGWAGLDGEADARTASPAQREASRTQGRLLLRTARRIWPSPVLDGLALAVPHGAHHPVALGAAAGVTGCAPQEAALAAAYTAVTGPATAAVRLLGLDPVAVHRLLADLAPDLERVAATAAARVPPLSASASPGPGSGSAPAAPPSPEPPGDSPWAGLPAHAAPALDLLAERHLRAGLRLFVS